MKGGLKRGVRSHGGYLALAGGKEPAKMLRHRVPDRTGPEQQRIISQSR